MAAINEKALSTKPWILEVALFDSSIPTLADDHSNILAYRTALDNLTYIRWASIIDTVVTDDFAGKITKIDASDTGTIYSEFEPDMSVAWSIYELDKDFLNKIYPVALTAIAGTVVNEIWEALWTGWTIGQPIKLANKMGDNTTVTSIVIDADAVALIVTTDYTSYVADWTNGDAGFTYIVPVTTQAGVLDADYDYTPNSATIGALVKKGYEIPRLVVRVKAQYTATLVKTDYLVDSGFEGQIIKKFTDVSLSWELGNSPFNFTANRLGTHISYDDYNV